MFTERNVFWKLVVLMCLLMGPSTLKAQEIEEWTAWLEVILEWMPEEQIENLDRESFFEYVSEIYKKPLNLNTVTEQQLASLLFLSPLQIRQILQYRSEVGSFVSVHELQGVESLTIEQIRLLSSLLQIPRLEVYPLLLKENDEKIFQQQLVFQVGRQIEKSKGFLQKGTSKSHYTGDPWRSVIKYKLGNPENWLLNLTIEKDPGELIWNSSKPVGFDFLSVGLTIPKLKNLENVLIGDYTLQFGEGLGLWMGYGTSKGSIFHGIAKPNGYSRMHTGTSEFAFMRGITATVSSFGFKFNPYLSFRKMDASVDLDLDSNFFAKTILSSGFHRTQTECINQRVFDQFIGGIHIEREFGWGQIGGNTYTARSDKKLDPDPIPRNLYRFRGYKFWNSSIYWKMHIKNFYFFGETAMFTKFSTALISGFLYSLGPELSLSFLYRRFDAAYHSFLPQAFGEQTLPQNETGYYTGILFQPNRYFSVFTYLDLFEFPWLKYRVDAPSGGWDFLVELRYSIRKSLLLKLRYRSGIKDENYDAGRTENVIIDAKNQLYRFEIDWKPKDRWEFRGKFHFQDRLRHERDTSLNALAAFDSFFKPTSVFQINTRVSFFKNLKGATTPIYFFENSVLNGHGSRAYQNPGFKYYTNIRIRFNKNHSLWLNTTQSWFPSLESIGTGLDEIPKNKKTDFKLVWRWTS